MSVWATSWAWKRPLDNNGAKLVLLALADFADEEGCCWPGHETIAEMAGISLRSVERQIAALIEMGLVALLGRRAEGRNGRQVYQLLAPADVLNPSSRRRAQRPDKLAGRQRAAAGADDPTTCRVVDRQNSPHVASPEGSSLSAAARRDDPPDCRVVETDDPPNPARRPAKSGATTRQIRHRSIEEPSREPSVDPSSLSASTTVLNPETSKQGHVELGGLQIGRRRRGRIDYRDPANRNAYADQQVHAVLAARGDPAQAWLTIFAARDRADQRHAEAKRECERIARSIGVAWEARP